MGEQVHDAVLSSRKGLGVGTSGNLRVHIRRAPLEASVQDNNAPFGQMMFGEEEEKLRSEDRFEVGVGGVFQAQAQAQARSARSLGRVTCD